MKSNTFDNFCKVHKIDIEEMPELQPVMWEQYRLYRAAVPVTDKTITDAIHQFKLRQADEQTGAAMTSEIVSPNFGAKVMRT